MFAGKELQTVGATLENAHCAKLVLVCVLTKYRCCRCLKWSWLEQLFGVSPSSVLVSYGQRMVAVTSLAYMYQT